jgi:hypothetical protein
MKKCESHRKRRWKAVEGVCRADSPVCYYWPRTAVLLVILKEIMQDLSNQVGVIQNVGSRDCGHLAQGLPLGMQAP